MTLRELVSWFEQRYPRSLAEDWDSVGVISGDWSQQISRVLLSVDVTNDVLDEAIALGVDCIVSHHPLVLPRHSIINEPYKFKLISRANFAGIALFNAHTNADNARPGVADALANLIGISDTEALVPTDDDSATGTGRIGDLKISLYELVELIEKRVPQSQPRLMGEAHTVVQRVAICPGAGDALLRTVRSSDADVYITSDLRHHPVAEHREAHGCALIDINHVAAERPWLEVLAQEMSDTFEVSLSAVDTRAWQ